VDGSGTGSRRRRSSRSGSWWSCSSTGWWSPTTRSRSATSSPQAQAASRRGFVNCVSTTIERYHGTYEAECLRVDRPATLEDARAVTAAFRRHYNEERPNQALSCANRPPRVAFPDLPPRPPLPAEVDPDAWLRLVDGRRYARTVRARGDVVVEHARYYVGQRLAGQRVAVAVAADARVLVVRHRGAVLKRLPLRGLHGERQPFEQYLALMEHEARAEARRGPGRIIRRAA
jgi:hypothetical protein